MLAGEFIKMTMDTPVKVRDRQTGKFLTERKDYENREVIGYYGRAHRFGNPGKMRAEIVVFVR